MDLGSRNEFTSNPSDGMVHRAAMTTTTRYTGHLLKRPGVPVEGGAAVVVSAVAVIALPPEPGTFSR
jgi:hypothetical protein